MIEIADSSDGYDFRIKASLYARAGFREYWIVDLVHDVVEVRRKPAGGEFTETAAHRRGDALQSSILALTGVKVDALLG